MFRALKIIFEYWNHTYVEKINFKHRIRYVKNFAIYNIRIIRAQYVLKLKKTKKYSLVETISELDCKTKHLFSSTNRSNFINKPNLYFSNENNFEQLEGSSPDIDIWMVYNCMVLSKSSSISGHSKTYNYTYSKMQPRHDFQNAIGQSVDSLSPKNMTFNIAKESNEYTNSIYIHLLKEHSQNYYHWLFEIMPKFIKICEIIEKNIDLQKEKYVLLLDSGLPKQFYEIIKLYATVTFEIRTVEKFELLHCNRIIYCTDFWLSLDNTRFSPNIIKEFFIDSYAVSLIRKKLKLLEYTNTKPTRKIYFERSVDQARSLSNAEQLKNFLIRQGFEVIKPGNLTFVEQVELLKEAKIVIGVSGAVFSNIIFMQPKTYAIILSPQTIAANYYIFQPMADVAKINLIHILTENISYFHSIHAAASINIDKVKAVLDDMYVR